MRLAVYTDYVYRRVGGAIHAERAFALFLAALVPHVDRLLLLGRLASDEDTAPYQLPAAVELAGLPHYRSLTAPAAVAWSLARSVRDMWRALDGIDTVWILGPYPHAIALAGVALARRRTVVLGVRQDWPRYVRRRRPARKWMHRAADVLEACWLMLARWLPVVAVGPELAARYAHSPAVLELAVSLVPAASLHAPPAPRTYSREVQVLSVGRLEEEKNPLLLADVLGILQRRGTRRWRMVIVGEGDLAPALRRRLQQEGVEALAELRGYVPMGPALLELYRSSHVLLHVSWTEGFPQVLLEAFAAGLPAVATAVGGVRQGADGAAVLVPPGDAAAAADALELVIEDAELRERLIAAGLRRVSALTTEAQAERLAAFLRSPGCTTSRSADDRGGARLTAGRA